MTFDERVQHAVRSPEPGSALRTLVNELAQEGHDELMIRELLESFVVRQRTAKDFHENDEEVLLDTLDAINGWCHPTGNLLRSSKPDSSTFKSPGVIHLLDATGDPGTLAAVDIPLNPG